MRASPAQSTHHYWHYIKPICYTQTPSKIVGISHHSLVLSVLHTGFFPQYIGQNYYYILNFTEIQYVDIFVLIVALILTSIRSLVTMF